MSKYKKKEGSWLKKLPHVKIFGKPREFLNKCQQLLLFVKSLSISGYSVKSAHFSDVVLGVTGLFAALKSKEFSTIFSTIIDITENPFLELILRFFKKVVFTALRVVAYGVAMYFNEIPWLYSVLVTACTIEFLVHFSYFKRLSKWSKEKPLQLSFLVLIGYSISSVLDPFGHAPVLIAVGLQTYQTSLAV